MKVVTFDGLLTKSQIITLPNEDIEILCEFLLSNTFDITKDNYPYSCNISTKIKRNGTIYYVADGSAEGRNVEITGVVAHTNLIQQSTPIITSIDGINSFTSINGAVTAIDRFGTLNIGYDGIYMFAKDLDLKTILQTAVIVRNFTIGDIISIEQRYSFSYLSI